MSLTQTDFPLNMEEISSVLAVVAVITVMAWFMTGEIGQKSRLITALAAGFLSGIVMAVVLAVMT